MFDPEKVQPDDHINKLFVGDQGRLNQQLERFASDLFMLWDTDSSGSVKLTEIVKNLIFLGFAKNEERVLLVFEPYVRQYNYQKKTLTKDDFTNYHIKLRDFQHLFQSDEYLPKFLTVLNNEVRKIRFVKEEKQKQVQAQTDAIKNRMRD